MTIHTAQPDGSGKSPAVIVIQEIFGVDPHIEDVAKRFADAGFFAAAPELFHRGGAGTVIPYAEMEKGVGERGKLSNDDILADLNATVDFLKSNPNVDADNIGIVGFCFGGFVSFLGAVNVAGIKASAVYYGGGILPRPDAPADAPRYLDASADKMNVPMIGFWGSEDGGIPVKTIDEIESTLKAKGKNYESHTYEGAGHGFFCDGRGSYNEAAAKDAWPRTLDFFKANLK
jgi:carboxymethylenebutenolidase